MSFSTGSAIRLKPLQEVDISLLIAWLRKFHIACWWMAEAVMTDEALFAKYSKKIAAGQDKAFIVLLLDKPIWLCADTRHLCR
jgi:hypothetical protein